MTMGVSGGKDTL
jgi:hypothetical protein